jgi:hypothetical protein
MHATCPAHLILFDLDMLIFKENHYGFTGQKSHNSGATGCTSMLLEISLRKFTFTACNLLPSVVAVWVYLHTHTHKKKKPLTHSFRHYTYILIIK